MRTTITLRDDLLARLKAEARRSNASLTATVNRVLELGIERIQPQGVREEYRARTFSMGFPPQGHLDKALALSAALEDEEVIRKQTLRK